MKRLFPPLDNVFEIDYLNAENEEEIEEFCLKHTFSEETQDEIEVMTHVGKLEFLVLNGFELEE